MTDSEQYLLGQLKTGIENLSKGQDDFRQEWREDKKLLFNGINNLSANGCAIGKQHSKDIDELKKRPEKLIGIGSALASVFAFIGSLIIWIFTKMKT